MSEVIKLTESQKFGLSNVEILKLELANFSENDEGHFILKEDLNDQGKYEEVRYDPFDNDTFCIVTDCDGGENIEWCEKGLVL